MQMLRFSLSFSLLLLLTACSAPVKDRFFWPIPPDQPKVEFIGHYYSESDLSKGALAQTMQSISGGTGEVLHQLYGIAGDGHGKIYVAEGIINQIKLLDFTTGTYGPLPYEFKFPFGLDSDSKGNLYVANRGRGTSKMGKEKGTSESEMLKERSSKIQVLSPAGIPLFSFGEQVLKEAMHIAVDEERGRIYVSDQQLHQVLVFSMQGELLQSIGKGKASGKDGEFHRPQGLAIDRAGNLYVSDQLNFRIQVFDPSGAFVKKFGKAGDSIEDFEAPMGLAFDSSGQLWIADFRKAAILTYDVSGPEAKFLFATKGPSSSLGLYCFEAPIDIYIDPGNRIFVSDFLARRVTVWQYLDKEYLAKNPIPANWMQRTDHLARWYTDSGKAPPAPGAEVETKLPDSIFTQPQSAK